jgi:hypothetical protein
MAQTEGCLICGKELIYSQTKEETTCYICGQAMLSDVKCPDGHFVCDTCHSSGANDIIEKFCRKTEMTDPIAIANHLMDNRKVKMHGPEHHFLVPAALLAAYYNHKEQPHMRNDMVQIARMRSEMVPGGFCGSHGNCGAAVGSGIFLSLITRSTPLKEEEWKLSNMMTATSLMRIAESGGPRCCKRDSFIAIKEGCRFIEKYLHVKLNITKDIRCRFVGRNRQCTGTECAFFNKNSN